MRSREELKAQLIEELENYQRALSQRRWEYKWGYLSQWLGGIPKTDKAVAATALLHALRTNYSYLATNPALGQGVLGGYYARYQALISSDSTPAVARARLPHRAPAAGRSPFVRDEDPVYQAAKNVFENRDALWKVAGCLALTREDGNFQRIAMFAALISDCLKKRNIRFIQVLSHHKAREHFFGSGRLEAAAIFYLKSKIKTDTACAAGRDDEPSPKGARAGAGAEPKVVDRPAKDEANYAKLEGKENACRLALQDFKAGEGLMTRLGLEAAAGLADAKALRKRVMQLALEHHPDKKGDPAKMAAVNEVKKLINDGVLPDYIAHLKELRKGDARRMGRPARRL